MAETLILIFALPVLWPLLWPFSALVPFFAVLTFVAFARLFAVTTVPFAVVASFVGLCGSCGCVFCWGLGCPLPPCVF